jgi:hypothetical protein
MIPKTLSATSVMAYEECSMRWSVEFLDRAPQPSNSAASLGSACHLAIEMFVKDGHYQQPGQRDAMRALYDQAYWEMFSDSERYEEGLELCLNWAKRQDWTGRTVLSTEQKRSFTLTTTAGDIPFNYIMDRMDKLDSGDIEVVDIKSLSRPVSAESLRHKIQARAYGLAAQLEHPDAERIWVTFDMLRFEPVGIVFTKADNEATLRYLQALAQRIVDDNNPTEQLGEGCRWCIRKGDCNALRKHAQAGGVLGVADLEEAAERYYEVKSAMAALANHEKELSAAIVQMLKDDDAIEAEAGEYQIKVGVSGRRVIDPERLVHVIGPEVMARYGTINVRAVDKLLKEENLTVEQQSQIRQLFRKNYGDPTPQVTKVSPF